MCESHTKTEEMTGTLPEPPIRLFRSKKAVPREEDLLPTDSNEFDAVDIRRFAYL
jgi:hypothetical protein